MSNINKIIIYFLQTSKLEYSKDRIIRLLFLTDWFYSLIYKEKLLNLHWGRTLSSFPELKQRFVVDFRYFKSIKKGKYIPIEYIVINKKSSIDNLEIDENVLNILNYINSKTIGLNATEFNNFIIKTEPMNGYHDSKNLNLIEIAKTMDTFIDTNLLKVKEG